MCFCYHWQADSSSLRSLCWADLAGSWWLSDLYTSLLGLTYKICRTILLNYFSNQRVALIFLTIFPSSPSLLLPTPRPSHLPSFSLFWFSTLLLCFQMAVMISSGFLIAWTPYVSVSFWSMFHSQEQDHMTPLITLLPCLFAKSSTVYNPVIYFFFQRTTRQELRRLQRVMFCCSHQLNSAAEVEKAEDQMGKDTDCNIYENGTDETCVGLVGARCHQSESQVMSLG